MRSACFVVPFLLAAALCAQDNSISVNVSKNVDLPPEEVYFGLTLLADQGTTIEQALAVLKDLGVAQKDFNGMSLQQYGPSPQQARVVFQFTLTGPYSKFKETSDKLQTLRRVLAVDQPTMELQVVGAQIGSSDATREDARQKALPDLIAEAKRRADQLAKAAGISVGSITGISDTSAIGAYIAPYPYYSGPSSLRTAFGLSVRFAVK